MDLNTFTTQIPVSLKSHPEVVFHCERPQLDDLKTLTNSVDQGRRIFDHCVANWDGLEMDGEPFDCNKANKAKLLKINATLCVAVANHLVEEVMEEVKIESGN